MYNLLLFMIDFKPSVLSLNFTNKLLLFYNNKKISFGIL